MFIRTLVTAEQYEKLHHHFSESKLRRVDTMLKKYIKQWELEDIVLIPYYSVNMLWRVNSKHHGQTVLKLHMDVDHYTTREITVLLKGLPLYCKLYQYSLEDGVLLLKDVAPAQSLHEIESLYDRCDVFIHVYNTIHSYESEHELYPSYSHLISNIRNWAIEHQKLELIPYIDEAVSYYEQLKLIDQTNLLLHGDLHHDNILYSPPDSYAVIDVKGVYDIRIMDIPRFILNECEESIVNTSRDNIINVIKYLSHKLNIEAEHIAMALCIESILSVTWTMQDKTEPYDTKPYITDHLYCKSFMQEFV